MEASHRFEAPRWFQRATVGLAVTLIVLELAVAALSSYIAAVVPTCAPTATREVLRLVWIALAVQGVAVTTFATATYAMARTVVEHDGSRLALRNSWRSWDGAVSDVTRAYVQLLGAFTARHGDQTVAERVTALLADPLADKKALFRFYSRAALESVQARLGWIEPDLAPLP